MEYQSVWKMNGLAMHNAGEFHRHHLAKESVQYRPTSVNSRISKANALFEIIFMAFPGTGGGKWLQNGPGASSGDVNILFLACDGAYILYI